MKTKKISSKNFKRNEISKNKLVTIYGGDITDPKPGTTTSNLGVGMTIIQQNLFTIPVPEVQ
ncbi:hypothetical protein [Flavobacterium frigoris]|uniref:Uncharacterized protein n=1 Tax=Flavobacterium frigoris TaxID=229204 RepID=A0A1H9NSI0_FLAFI|nr:hypothetical protein [Flavobacterium frigoris]SER38872.1 hypothetical protein SAMN05444355_11179 [Flavobacterium frigoris]